jgi:flagellar hook-length control protein FliK
VNLEAALAPTTISAGPAPNAGAPPGSSPPSGAPPFHSALAEHWARTAQAEGQSQGDSHSSHHHSAVHDTAQTSATAQASEAGLGAASLEAQSHVSQSQVSGEAGEAAAKTATEAADSDTLAGGKASDSTAGSQRVDAPLESTLVAGEPSGVSTPGEESTSSSEGGVVEGIPVLGRDRLEGAPSGSGLAGTNVLASGHGSRGASAPASDDPTSTPAQPPASQGGGIVGVPVKAASAPEAPTAAAGHQQAIQQQAIQQQASQQQASDARALQVNAGEAAEGIDVTRSNRGTRLAPGPIARGAGLAKGSLLGAAGGAAAGLTVPGSVASEVDSLLAASSGAQAPASAASNTAAPLMATGVGMQEMIESIRATIEIAARQGATQARIALHPQELGHIAIRLSQTDDGLLARVSAETPAAAQALADGRAELHQTLSSLGVTLLRLDIGSFTQSQTGERDQSASGQSGSSSTSGEADSSEEVQGVQAPEQTRAPAGIGAGELVDVLA